MCNVGDYVIYRPSDAIGEYETIDIGQITCISVLVGEDFFEIKSLSRERYQPDGVRRSSILHCGPNVGQAAIKPMMSELIDLFKKRFDP